MKKLLCILVSLALCLSMGACGSGSGSSVDVDLTKLSSTMVYAEVSNMILDPDAYLGKTVKMNGSLAAWYDETRDRHYFTCIISDATACCAQGIEFIWAGHAPEDYPPAETRVTVVGTFNTYDEDGYIFCQLEDADVTW